MTEPNGSPTGRRIVVVGGTGSGKSTLAKTLAGRLNVLMIELDALFWRRRLLRGLRASRGTLTLTGSPLQ